MECKLTFIMSQEALIQSLIDNSSLKSGKVIDVYRSVDRANYCTENAYEDAVQNIGYGATISAPHMHTIPLEHIQNELGPRGPGKSIKCLDIGSGSGIFTVYMALLALANEQKVKAIGIEHIQDLRRQSIVNIMQDGRVELLNNETISIVFGDGKLGYKAEAPFDIIHLGASLSDPDIKDVLTDQLAHNGLMVLPYGTDYLQFLVLVRKAANGSISQESLFPVHYSPLL
jgi:protein-L-isoaspartate(D-aspartate) O-methyltransferase